MGVLFEKAAPALDITGKAEEHFPAGRQVKAHVGVGLHHALGLLSEVGEEKEMGKGHAQTGMLVQHTEGLIVDLLLGEKATREKAPPAFLLRLGQLSRDPIFLGVVDVNNGGDIIILKIGKHLVVTLVVTLSAGIGVGLILLAVVTLFFGLVGAKNYKKFKRAQNSKLKKA